MWFWLLLAITKFYLCKHSGVCQWGWKCGEQDWFVGYFRWRWQLRCTPIITKSHDTHTVVQETTIQYWHSSEVRWSLCAWNWEGKWTGMQLIVTNLCVEISLLLHMLRVYHHTCLFMAGPVQSTSLLISVRYDGKWNEIHKSAEEPTVCSCRHRKPSAYTLSGRCGTVETWSKLWQICTKLEILIVSFHLSLSGKLCLSFLISRMLLYFAFLLLSGPSISSLLNNPRHI